MFELSIVCDNCGKSSFIMAAPTPYVMELSGDYTREYLFYANKVFCTKECLIKELQRTDV